MGLKPWRGHKGLLIPDQHTPGEQKGFRNGSKHGGSGPSFTSGANGRRERAMFWPVGRWAGGAVK